MRTEAEIKALITKLKADCDEFSTHGEYDVTYVQTLCEADIVLLEWVLGLNDLYTVPKGSSK